MKKDQRVSNKNNINEIKDTKSRIYKYSNKHG